MLPYYLHSHSKKVDVFMHFLCTTKTFQNDYNIVGRQEQVHHESTEQKSSQDVHADEVLLNITNII